MDCSDESKLKLYTDHFDHSNSCNKPFSTNVSTFNNDVSEKSNGALEKRQKGKQFCIEQDFYGQNENKASKGKISVPFSEASFPLSPATSTERLPKALEENSPKKELLDNKPTAMLTCDICKKQFTENNQLTEHLFGHISSTSSFQPYDFDSGIKKGSESLLNLSCSSLKEDGEIDSENNEEQENEKINSCSTEQKPMPLLTSQSPAHQAYEKQNSASDVFSTSSPSPPPASSSSPLSVSPVPTVKQETSLTVASENVTSYETNTKTMKSNMSSSKSVQRSKCKKELKCDICQRIFTRTFALKRHLRIHTGEKPFTCNVCHKSFFQSSDLTQHLRVHTGERPFKCSLCTAAFSQLSALSRHLRCHFGEKPYVCTVCQRAFSQSSALTRHMCSHSEVKHGNGDIINKGVVAEQEECKEINSPSIEQKSVPFYMAQSGDPKLQEKQNNTSETLSLSCLSKPPMPPSSLSSSSLMLEPSLSVSMTPPVKQETSPTVTSENDQTYKTGAEKMKTNVSHSKSVQPNKGEKEIKCNICQRVFTRAFALKRHLRIHSGERPFTCNVCHKSFFQSSDLTQHLRVHTGERPFKCSLCTAAFSQLSALSRHLRCHFGEKPYVCSVCQRAFSQSSALTRHMCLHAEEKLYSCEICGESFTWSEPLLRHMWTHTGEKPHKCEICSKTFSRASNLSTHMRVHSGEKPFICPLCGRAFPVSSNLTRHMKTHKEPVNEQTSVAPMTPTILTFDSLTEPTV